MAASAANVVRAFLLATVRAISRVASNKGVMRAAHVAAGFRSAILRDSHVTTSGSGDMPRISLVILLSGRLSLGAETQLE